MELGEKWAYRARISDPECPLVPAEIIQFGPPKKQKVRVRWLGGDYPGLDEWVAKVRLRVLWEEREAWLRDERLFEAVRAASIGMIHSPEYRAALMAVYRHPVPDGILIGYGRSEGATLRIADLETIARDLGFEPQALLAEPLAFVDRHGEYVAPWPVARRVAERVAQRYADVVLAHVAKEERELQDRVIHGYSFQWDRDHDVYVPPEKCADALRQQQPAFELVREWGGSASTERFNELAALRAEVEGLRKLVEDAATSFENQHLRAEARRLRRALNTRGA